MRPIICWVAINANRELTVTFKKEQLVIVWCCLLGAFLISSLITRAFTWVSILIFGIAFVVLLSGINGFVWLASKMTAKSCEDLIDFIAEINKLPIEEVKAQAEGVLENEVQFLCEKADSPIFTSGFLLGQLTEEFFSKYISVQAVNGDTAIGRCYLSQSDYASGFIRIGIDTDFIEYVVKAREDQIYIAGEDGDPEGSLDKTIYHLILSLDYSMRDQ